MNDVRVLLLSTLVNEESNKKTNAENNEMMILNLPIVNFIFRYNLTRKRLFSPESSTSKFKLFQESKRSENS